jgi:hypothetical protein
MPREDENQDRRDELVTFSFLLDLTVISSPTSTVTDNHDAASLVGCLSFVSPVATAAAAAAAASLVVDIVFLSSPAPHSLLMNPMVNVAVKPIEWWNLKIVLLIKPMAAISRMIAPFEANGVKPAIPGNFQRNRRGACPSWFLIPMPGGFGQVPKRSEQEPKVWPRYE